MSQIQYAQLSDSVNLISLELTRIVRIIISCIVRISSWTIRQQMALRMQRLRPPPVYSHSQRYPPTVTLTDLGQSSSPPSSVDIGNHVTVPVQSRLQHRSLPDKTTARNSKTSIEIILIVEKNSTYAGNTARNCFPRVSIHISVSLTSSHNTGGHRCGVSI